VAVVLALSVASGCAWWGEQNRTTKGAVYGTGAGAATGAALGAILGGGSGAAKGAAIGAVVGGLAGTGVGYYMDRQAKEMQAVLDRQDRLERDGETLRASLASDVLFDSGKATLYPGASDKLKQIADVLQKYPRTHVEIVGHTDNRGSEQSNVTLSQRRAESVRNVLTQDGVSAVRITANGAGESRPVSTNDTATGRAMNRRVEITVRPDDTTAGGNEGERGAPPPAPTDEPR
jgi:outer membrane protein OmpA-like peptidoglycan-associated protein